VLGRQRQENGELEAKPISKQNTTTTATTTTTTAFKRRL
jgi:hypothetical protein